MVGKFFLSYRRAENPALIGRIYDRMVREFGAEAVFLDVDSIPLGVDFAEHLREQVRKCSLLVAVVGKEWIARIPNLHRSEDFVRIELSEAIERELPIVPLLVDCEMPDAVLLPPELKKFTSMNGTSLDPGRDFHVHMERFIKSVRTNAKPPEQLPSQSASWNTRSISLEVMEAIDWVEEVLSGPNVIRGISTGFPQLDLLCGGLRKGETYVLASPFGPDVTTFAANLLDYIAVDAGRNAVWIHTRDDQSLLVRQLLATRAKLWMADLSRGLLNRSNQDWLAKSTRDMQRSQIQFVAGGDFDCDEFVRCVSSSSVGNADVVFLDDVYALNGIRSPDAFRRLTLAVRKLRCVLVCVARMNSPRISRRSPIIQFHDAELSSDFLNEAALTGLLTLHEEALDEDAREDSSGRPNSIPATLEILGNRNGKTDAIAMSFDLAIRRFTEIVPEN